MTEQATKEMQWYDVRCESTAWVPADWEPLYNHDRSRQIGFRLPDGRTVRAWTVWELTTSEEGVDSHDLSYLEAAELGLHYDHGDTDMDPDFTRDG